MKAKFRTPRRILSVFLCILMLATTVVIANPFTAEAVTAHFRTYEWHSGEYYDNLTWTSGNDNIVRNLLYTNYYTDIYLKFNNVA